MNIFADSTYRRVCRLHPFAFQLFVRNYAGRASKSKRGPPSRKILSKKVIEPSPAQKSRMSHEDFRLQRLKYNEFRQRQETTSLLEGPPNSGSFGSLTRIPYEVRNPLNATVGRLGSFESLRILPLVREAVYNRALIREKIKRPSAIQALAIHRIQKLPAIKQRMRALGLKSPEEEELESDEEYYGRREYRKSLPNVLQRSSSYLIAAETGSGKTLAYLIPLLSQLKEEEIERSPAVWSFGENEPYVRSIVLVPTAELVKQVLAIVKNMCHDIKLSSAGLSQETSKRSRFGLLKKRVDILVCTPIPLLRILRRNEGNEFLSHCRKIIVDEADSLMDRSFKDDTEEIIRAIKMREMLIFCSATIPKQFDRMLRHDYPNMQRIVTPHLHQVPAKVAFRVLRVSEKPFFDDKRRALTETLFKIDRDSEAGSGKLKRVVVFVNHRESVDEVVNYLKEHNIEAEGLNRDSGIEHRGEVMEELMKRPPSLKTVSLVDGRMKTLRVIVTTDVFSRGVDMQNIETVILYDVPFTSIDLIHRAGRTGRMGNQGQVILFATKNELKPWVRGLEKTIGKNMALA
ncbi:P-loop containing nucleoside triphosphate hydrolase protein [Dipodascopsis uninucleata]